MVEQRFSVMLLSSATTLGQRNSDDDWARVLEQAGADVAVVRPPLDKLPPLYRLAITDVVQALGLAIALFRARARKPCDFYFLATTTSSFFLPKRVLRRSALRFDALACENRPGRGGSLSRALERRALKHIPVLMPMTTNRDPALRRERFLRTARLLFPVPPPVPDASPDPAHAAKPTVPDHVVARVVCYAGNPAKKGLDVVVAAWAELSAYPSARLIISGVAEGVARQFLQQRGIAVPAGVEFTGRLDRAEFAKVLSSATIFVAASRYEDYGMAQMEAIDAGTTLVTTPSAGPFEVRKLLTGVAAQLMSASSDPGELAATLRWALNLDPAERAEIMRPVRSRLEPYRWTALVTRTRNELLPFCRKVSAVPST